MNLDISVRTIFLALGLGNFFFLILMKAYYYKKEMEFASKIFIQAKAMQTLAWIIMFFKGVLPDVMSVLLANIVLIFGAIWESAAVMIMDGSDRRKVFVRYLILLAGSILGFFIIFLFQNKSNIRIAFISLATAILFIYPTWKLFTNSAANPLKRVWSYLYFIVILSFVFRAYMALFVDTNMQLLDDVIGNTLTFIVLFVHMIVVNSGLILLAKEKADLQLLEAASKDEMTNIFNRRTFAQNAEKQLAASKKLQEPVSFMMMDIDNFKVINDTFGHLIGDVVLKEMAAIIKTKIRNQDILGRFGGDEIAILLPGLDSNQSHQIAQNIIQSICSHTYDEKLNVAITLSVGISTLVPNMHTCLDDLYRLSDEAMYVAKTQGKNRIILSNQTLKDRTIFDS